MEPIEGSRFKCKTCPNFNYCETCFRLRRSHRHSFHRFEEPSSIPVNAGKSGRGKKKIMSGGLGGPEHIVKEWDRVVKSLMVSSRETHAGRLIDGTESYWQSAGSQGKVRIFRSRSPEYKSVLDSTIKFYPGLFYMLGKVLFSLSFSLNKEVSASFLSRTTVPFKRGSINLKFP